VNHPVVPLTRAELETAFQRISLATEMYESATDVLDETINLRLGTRRV
jgi:hypothetical protein